MLKTELERFGDKKLQTYKNPLSREQQTILKEFTQRRRDVIVKKADNKQHLCYS